MVISLDLEATGPGDVVVQHSPLAETMAMLHLNTEREHHLGQRAVLSSIDERSTAALRERISVFAPLWARLRCRLFFPLGRAVDATWDGSVRSIGELDDRTFQLLAAEGVLGVGRHRSTEDLLRTPAAFVDACAQRSTLRRELAQRLTDDPARFRSDLLDILATSWDSFASQLWNAVHGRLEEATQRIRAVVRDDVPGAVASLSPTASPAVGSTVRFDKLDTHTIRTQGAALCIIPSVHHAPHLTIKSGLGLPTSILAPIARSSEVLSLDDLHRRLRAVSSPFRMGLIRHLLGEPITTGELTIRVGTEASQISRALSQLRDAGIVRSERVNGALVHRVDHDVLRRLGLDIVSTVMR